MPIINSAQSSVPRWAVLTGRGERKRERKRGKK
jgi:hypothetical protein